MLSSDEGLNTQSSDTSDPLSAVASETPSHSTHEIEDEQKEDRKDVNATDLAVGRVWSKHPQSASFLRRALHEIDQRHFGTGQSHKASANVLVVGPKAVGKSSFVMKALVDRFESNGDQLDLDQCANPPRLRFVPLAFVVD
jgi:polynucleotide 5'-kinase involved in rRNA processing